MTQQEANEIIQTSHRCTQATLRAFGLEGIPKTGSGCLEFLKQGNLKYQLDRKAEGKAMKKFFNNSPILLKDWLIATKGHAMAIVDGILIDTELKGFDNRVIEFAWVVSKEIKDAD